jgi:hypothetical protein
MRASINQTGRKTISSDSLAITINENHSLLFTWNLSQEEIFDFNDAVLEISTFAGLYRFSVPLTQSSLTGEYVIDVSKVFEPQSSVGRLKLIRTNADSIRFVAAESKILRLQNNRMEGDHGKSLLDVYYDPMLKSPWQLVFEDAEPVLKVSNYYDNATKIYTNAIFQTSILPEVVRQITFWLLTEDPNPSENPKIEHWWAYLAELGLDAETRQTLTSTINRDQEFVSEVVLKSHEISDSFAARYNILQRLVNSLEDES